MALSSRRRFLTGLAFAAPIILSACRQKRTEGDPSKPLRVSIFPSIINGGLYLAQEDGLFSAEGLAIRFLTFKNTSQTVPLLAGDQLEAAASGMSSALLSAVSQGARVRIVAAIGEAHAACGNGGALYVRAGEFRSGAEGVRRLTGRRVAISAIGGLGEFFLDLMLRDSGLTSRDLTLLQLPQTEGIAALLGRQVDAVVYSHLDKEAATRSGSMAPIRQVDDVYPRLQFNFMLFGPKLLQSDPEKGRKLLRAIFLGNQRFLAGETPVFLREFIQSSRLDQDVALRGCRDGVTATGSVNPEHVQSFIDWAASKGYCSKPLQASDLIDDRFLNR